MPLRYFLGGSVISPLPVEQEQLVIVQIGEDGYADTRLVHLPAERLERGGFRFDSYDFPPNTWPPACGGIRSGSVYVRGGEFAKARVCPACEEAA